MTYETLLVEKLDTRVGLIRLNRPKALNALNGDLMREMMVASSDFDKDEAVGVIVITGSEKAFAAGADIKDMAEASPAQMFGRSDFSMWEHVASLKKPVIAAVSGFALGGGLELAMACDMIVASESAQFGQPEINLGIIPGAGGTQRLTRAVGKALAMEMVLNDRRITAAEALNYGLVNRVYPVESYLEEALKLAAAIAARAPIAVQVAKQCVNKAYEMTLAESIAYEARSFHFLFGTQDQREGMQAFIEKRPATWTGQ